MRNAHRILVRRLEGKRSLGRSKCAGEDNIDWREGGREGRNEKNGNQKRKNKRNGKN
jgi:hypothetical protein